MTEGSDEVVFLGGGLGTRVVVKGTSSFECLATTDAGIQPDVTVYRMSPPL